MDSLTLAYILIGAGAVFMLAELFIPSGGVLSVVAVGLMIGGVVMVFYYGTTFQAVVTLAAVFVAVPILMSMMFSIWPHTPMGKRLIRSGQPDEEDVTVASMPVNLELEQLRGRYGRALSTLRPSGTVEFDGRRIDAMSEGMLIEEGQSVKCIDVRAGKVVVRAAERPGLEEINPSKLDDMLS